MTVFAFPQPVPDWAAVLSGNAFILLCFLVFRVWEDKWGGRFSLEVLMRGAPRPPRIYHSSKHDGRSYDDGL